jgi:hypothetical protein
VKEKAHDVVGNLGDLVGGADGAAATPTG